MLGLRDDTRWSGGSQQSGKTTMNMPVTAMKRRIRYAAEIV